MASPKGKASKMSATTSANAGVDAAGKVFVDKSDKPECLLVREILSSMRR
jgi:hypothetical protein